MALPAVPPYYDLTSTLAGLSISKSEPPPLVPPEIQGYGVGSANCSCGNAQHYPEGRPDVLVSPCLAVNAAEPTDPWSRLASLVLVIVANHTKTKRRHQLQKHAGPQPY